MNAVIFIVDTLLRLALCAFILRLLMQWSRADFRNPVSQAVVRVTNPLVMPLRRILPPIGKIDTATVIAVILVALIYVLIKYWLLGFGLLPALLMARFAATEIAVTVLWTYFYAIVLYALLSLIAPGGYSPVQSLLISLCEPVLRPIRRTSRAIARRLGLPSLGGLDLSPLWAGIIIQALLILLR
jgi:YggT family protein